MNDSFDELTARFLSWFKQLPGATFSDAIAIRDLRSRKAGRGIVALQDIPAETVLFTIPRNSIISLETSAALRDRLPALLADAATSSSHGKEANDDADDDDHDPPAQLDAWSALILVLVHEHLRGADSPWRPYLDVLPDAFATPMFWTADELAALQASPAVAKVGRDDADNMLRGLLLPVIRAHPHLFAGSAALTDEQLLALAHRMGSTIMAYAFDLESDDDDDDDNDNDDGNGDGWVEDRDGKAMLGMVPMADILNADAEFNAHVNHGDDNLTVTALRPIKAGEEILNYYGPHPNSELLRRYGYVTERHARYDVIEVPWKTVEAAAVSHLGLTQEVWAKVRGQLEEDEMEETFVIERDCPEVTSEGLFPTTTTTATATAITPQVTALPGDLKAQLREFLGAVRAVDASSRVVPADKRQRDDDLVVAIVGRALRALQALYPTTLAEDEQILAAAAAGHGRLLSDRERMAVVVRAGEKRVLLETMAFLDERTRELQQQLQLQQQQQQRRRWQDGDRNASPVKKARLG